MNYKKYISVLLVVVICLTLTACGSKISETDVSTTEATTTTVESTTENLFIHDGVIQETNIFEIEKKIKNTAGYVWSDDHSVIEGLKGFFGTLYCEEQDIWCDLYSNDLKEITSAKITVSEADFDLLVTFASLFDTTLIDANAVVQWLENYSSHEEYTKVFGDADFYLSYDETYTLYITAVE